MSERKFKEAPTAEEVMSFRATLVEQIMERFGVDEDSYPRVFMGNLWALTLHEPHRFEMIPHEYNEMTLEEKAEILRRVVYNAKIANERLFQALDSVNRGLREVHDGQRIAERGEEIKQAVRDLSRADAPADIVRHINQVGRVVLGREAGL
jgi:hypothetical protein